MSRQIRDKHTEDHAPDYTLTKPPTNKNPVPQGGCMPRSKALLQVSMYVVSVGEILEYFGQYGNCTQVRK